MKRGSHSSRLTEYLLLQRVESIYGRANAADVSREGSVSSTSSSVKAARGFFEHKPVGATVTGSPTLYVMVAYPIPCSALLVI